MSRAGASSCSDIGDRSSSSWLYAHDRKGAHFPAWGRFNRAVYGAKSDAVGIWHETYLVEPGKFECIHGNMPLFGLAAAMRHVPATGRLAHAKERMAGIAARDWLPSLGPISGGAACAMVTAASIADCSDVELVFSNIL